MASISFSALTAALGAEVQGLDLSRKIDASRARLLRDALAEHHVLFFRGQHLDEANHRALAAVLGEPMVHPFERAMGRSDPLHRIIDKPETTPDRAGWHTDDSYLERPPAYAILCCEVAPDAGGDTAWSNMALAYERLSPAMKALLGGLEGEHETQGSLLDYLRTHLPPDRLAEAERRVGSGATHPIVRLHPETGRSSLYFETNFMRRIVGLSAAESEFVRGFLAEQSADLSLQCRFRWRAGDVAIWDERTTQHAGSADHAGQLRVMRRCTVEGERPIRGA